MANLIDEDDNEELQQDVTNIADVEPEQVQQPEPEPQEEPSAEDLPDKYKGKTVKDIVRMHQEAEKALGRQGSEVGELRRLVDDFIKAQTVAKQQAPDSVEEEVDFFADPKTAINRAIEKHPKIQEAEMLTAHMKRAEALATLKSSHPDFQDIIQSPEFADWVGKSRVRQELYVRADKGFDFDAANELLSTWKERQSVVEKTKAVEQIERKQAVKAASTTSAKGAADVSSKKTYRRADIINLMIRDPDRYQALQPEIMAAYADGRVK